jgi:Co/Zn/Cd efflux system component
MTIIIIIVMHSIDITPSITTTPQEAEAKLKKDNFLSKIPQKAKLIMSMVLNLCMGVGWATAALAGGGSSSLLPEATDSIADAFSYAISLAVNDKNNKAKAIAVFCKALISFVFSIASVAFAFVRFGLKWAANPTIGLALSGVGILINGVCALLMKPQKNERSDLNSEDRGQQILQDATWLHTIGDLKAGALAMFFSILDLVKVPGADLAGGTVGGYIGFTTSLEIFKEAIELWKLHKKEIREKRGIEIPDSQNLNSIQMQELNESFKVLNENVRIIEEAFLKADIQNLENDETLTFYDCEEEIQSTPKTQNKNHQFSQEENVCITRL